MRYDVFGVGNALVDIQARVSDHWVAETGFEKGIMTLVDDGQQKSVLSRLDGISLNRCAGGSAANTIMGIAHFGGKAAYAGKVANDEVGEFFLRDMQDGSHHRRCCGCLWPDRNLCGAHHRRCSAYNAYKFGRVGYAHRE